MSQNGTHWSRNALDAPPNHLFNTLLLSNVLAAIISHLYPQYHYLLCRVPYSLQDNCFQKRDNGEEGLGMLPPYALPLSPCESDTEPGNQWVGLELLADNRQINRHCLFSKKKLLYWKIFWMFLDILDVFGGRW